MATILGIHALKRGYRVKLYTYNLLVFDPTWFHNPGINMIEKIKEQKLYKKERKIQVASDYYINFMELGGEIDFQDPTPELLHHYLKNNIPILTGVSATYLYQCPRELPNTDFDDVLGEPTGHFVVIAGHDTKENSILVADPWEPVSKEIYGSKYYWVSIIG